MTPARYGFLLLIFHASRLGAWPGLASIPAQDTCLLPQPFNSSIEQGFIDTHTSSLPTNHALSHAHNQTFVSYHSEFDQIFGDTPSLQLVAASPTNFAYEAGVWVQHQV